MTPPSSEDSKAFYLALRGIFTDQNAQLRRLKKISRLIDEHKQQPPISKLIQEHGIDAVYNNPKQLLSARVFESPLAARKHFSELPAPMTNSLQQHARTHSPKLTSLSALLALSDHDIDDGNEIAVAPIFSESVRQFGERLPKIPFTQYGLLGADTTKMSKIVPDGPLSAEVWPQLDKWKEAHSSPLSDFRVEQNMAAGAFLELMEWLREVLLQDAVFLRESYPDHPLFQDPVFLVPSLPHLPAKSGAHPNS
ncbi:hypothetical protein HIM_11913 [Hirsutella minnesotensis 3608]|uniref:Ndc10 domain-containing protein n=1 Tax=Hirsutella minnesotensis 3608 TaxID=1043627 RepID=A0A0F8A0N8_9HYPO|nr:hypothetical protein HIM_11913 [Hirsutella minnesotensis 3608]